VTVVLDASAILAYLKGEDGADLVEEHLADDPRCGAANWAEVAQKIRGAGRDWSISRALLASYGIVVENVTESDGEWAAARWRLGEGLSLADRLCLSLAHRLQAIVLTADTAWGQQEPIRQIR
jgi:PIN domain nuclease of toxin-antitoxin system